MRERERECGKMLLVKPRRKYMVLIQYTSLDLSVGLKFFLMKIWGKKEHGGPILRKANEAESLLQRHRTAE